MLLNTRANTGEYLIIERIHRSQKGGNRIFEGPWNWARKGETRLCLVASRREKYPEGFVDWLERLDVGSVPDCGLKGC